MKKWVAGKMWQANEAVGVVVPGEELLPIGLVVLAASEGRDGAGKRRIPPEKA
jgi:hypothetical protein